MGRLCPVVKKIMSKTVVSACLGLCGSAFASSKTGNSKYTFFDVAKNCKIRKKR
jgi:hypothetical protein